MGAQGRGSHVSRGQCSDLSTLAQKADVVCPSASDAIRNHSPADADPAADDDGDFQGTIQLPPPHNDADSGAIRGELDRLVASAILNEINVEKVIHSVVVDASHTTYKNGNILFLKYFLMGVLVCCHLMQWQCLRHSTQSIWL